MEKLWITCGQPVDKLVESGEGEQRGPLLYRFFEMEYASPVDSGGQLSSAQGVFRLSTLWISMWINQMIQIMGREI